MLKMLMLQRCEEGWMYMKAIEVMAAMRAPEYP
jgi:hypothetical protein